MGHFLWRFLAFFGRVFGKGSGGASEANVATDTDGRPN